LAVKAGMTVRHLHRLVTSAGLTSPLKVLVAGRTLRAYQFFRSSEDTTLDQAARRLRIDPRSLSVQIRSTLELDSVADTRTLEPSEAVTRCVRTLYRPPAAMLRAAGDTSDN
jgi:AraC-like DNA-binding protein